MTPADEVAEVFRGRLGREPDGVWWAPGRVNLIGEHTDYNDGFVLPFALPVGVAVAAARRPDRLLRAVSLQQPDEVTAEVDALAPGSVTGWAAYVAGVVWSAREAGHEPGGSDLVASGDVPVGAGLSSSAALGCAVAAAVTDLAGAVPGPAALAALARRAENDYVGAPTGAMDQLASVHGRAGCALFLDTRTLAVEHVPLDLASAGLALLVVDTRTPHALVDGAYAERRRACEAGARALGVAALRDVPLAGLPAALARLDDPVVRRRVRHVVTEDARVLDVVALLREGRDLRGLGPHLTASHASMRDDFEITVPQVDTAVTAALAAGAYGARMTGGGFGGCVLALVDADTVERTAAAVESAYDDAGFAPPRCWVTAPAAGAHRVR